MKLLNFLMTWYYIINEGIHKHFNGKESYNSRPMEKFTPTETDIDLLHLIVNNMILKNEIMRQKKEKESVGSGDYSDYQYQNTNRIALMSLQDIDRLILTGNCLYNVFCEEMHKHYVDILKKGKIFSSGNDSLDTYINKFNISIAEISKKI